MKSILILRLVGPKSQVLKLLELYCKQHGNKTLAEIAEGK